jgi:TPR repeat protein
MNMQDDSTNPSSTRPLMTALILAWAALWTSALGVGLLLAIPAVVFGHQALDRLRKNDSRKAARRWARGSLAMGYLAIAISLCTFPLYGRKLYKDTWKFRPTEQKPTALIKELKQTGPDKAYARLLNLWNEGHQLDVEAALEELVEKAYPHDQNLAFMRAALLRSRGYDVTSASLFDHVHDLAPRSVLGRASRHLSYLTYGGNEEEKRFIGLRRLVRENPDELLLLWMLGLSYRTYEKHDEAVAVFEKLLSRLKKGSSLVHHTYANVLEYGRSQYKEALPHRELAVQLEPKDWSYRALGNTLGRLLRYEEALAAYTNAIQLDPEEATSWAYCGWALGKLGRIEESIEKCQKAVELDPENGFAWRVWGSCLARRGQQTDALEKYRIAVSNYDSYAMYQLGWYYENGIVVTQDYPQAMEWYSMAADFGEADGINAVGLMHEHGRGVPTNCTKALQWYRLAASNEHDWAMHNIGNLYDHGLGGLPQDRKQAVHWYLRAAEGGNTHAMQDVGYHYEKGWGVPRSMTNALHWYRAAAEQDDTDAMLYLGNKYLYGHGVKRDPEEAIPWLLKASNQTHADADNELAWFYATTSDSKYRDPEKALAFALSATRLEPDSSAYQDTLAAAYAAHGYFADAVQTQQRAIELLKQEPDCSTDDLEEFEERLELYRDGKAYVSR